MENKIVGAGQMKHFWTQVYRKSFIFINRKETTCEFILSTPCIAYAF